MDGTLVQQQRVMVWGMRRDGWHPREAGLVEKQMGAWARQRKVTENMGAKATHACR